MQLFPGASFSTSVLTESLSVTHESTCFKNLLVSHLSTLDPSCDVALCIRAITFVEGLSRFTLLATPLNAGASDACQNGSNNTSTSPSSKIKEAVFFQDLGLIESKGASEREGVECPVRVWVSPGKRMEGYCRLQL